MTSKFELAAPMAVPPTWTFPNTFGALSPQLLAAGDKLIAVAGRTVFAVDIHTGELARGGGGQPWMVELQGMKGREPNVTTAKGVVYMMDDDSLLAVGLGDAQPIASWPKARKPQVPQCKRLIVHDGRLVALNTGKGGSTVIRGFDPLTGEQKFGPFERSEKSVSQLAYGAKAVFFVTSGTLLSLNADFGDERWRFKPADDLLDSAMEPLVTDKLVFVGGNKALHALDTKTGETRYRIAAKPGETVHWYTPVASIPKTRAAASETANLKVVRPLLGDVQGASAMLHAAVQRVAGGVGVAVNDAGDIVGFRIADGSEVWREHFPLPGPPVLLDDVVYITTDGGKHMRQFNVNTGEPVAVPFDLSTPSDARPAVIANGNLFSINATGNIEARAFADEHAAYFDGKSAHIKVPASAAQYDFGTGDFTVEAWFRSSTGGEIVSSYPTGDDPGAHGFRLRLQDGQVRVAVLDRSGASRHVGATNDTGADDGQWHHVAFVRRLGQFRVVLDGVSQVVNLGGTRATSLSIGGTSAITIGAFIFPGLEARQFFRGQIREVRIWNHAVDVVNIAANRDAELKGMEPSLKGLWRLDENQRGATKAAVLNMAHRNRMAAQFVNADSRITDLKMDQSAFPYLLHEPRAQWPYAGTWGARGKNVAVSAPTRSSDGIVAFATNDSMYAVDAHDGRRIWAMTVKSTTSAPCGDGAGFLFMTYEDSLVRVDSRSGAKIQVAAFAQMPHESDSQGAGGGAQYPAPAVSSSFMAAANNSITPTVMIWDRIAATASATKLSGHVARLGFCDQGLLVVTKDAAGASTLQVLDSASAAVLGRTSVGSDVLCAAGTWAFAVRGKCVVQFGLTSHAGGPLAAPLATSASMGDEITGLAASADDDMLVATLANGHVCRMRLGSLETVWDKPAPLGRAHTRTSLFPPVIDAGGRVICTSQSGSIAALDGETGRVMGLYAMDHSPRAQPAIAPGGTLFVTCEDSVANDAAENVDGAMHSLVLGETTVLRLNMDASGRPVAGQQHAVIDVPADSATLHLMEVHESCVEAWINAPRFDATGGATCGGGILSIMPSAESKFDIHLWLEPDGVLHYSSRAFDDGAWTGLHYTVQTSLLDGRWHHVAASRTPPTAASVQANAGATDRVLIYIDGAQVEAKRVASPAAPTATCTGLKAYVGASAADDLSATRPFHGMIAEVRVWDTWLVAPEITRRMHVKLRGDEPDLLAYWNFDHGSVHDGAAQGHDGVIAHAVTDPVWWLTDLPFTQPSYPHINSSGSAIASDDESQSTTYSLTLQVFAADGTAMPSQEVHLWFVKKKGAPASSILIDGESVEGVDPSEEAHPLLLGLRLHARHAEQLKRAWKGTTSSDGTLTVSIVAPLGTGSAANGPGIDMWTSFMPLNERFHVNVLIDGQKLAKPAPPRLTAQAKLIQDYHYTTGSKIDHTRDRSTWRTVIRAASASDRPRAYEPVTLWASDPVTFEANTKTYTVNKDNAVTLETGADGELTLVMAAEELSAPTIYARAGFMHRDDRILINPDQDAHAQLAEISDEDLTKERSTSWKRPQDRKAGDDESMLPADARGEAPKVGNAVRQVARATKPASEHAPPRSLRMSPARERLLSMRPLAEGERRNLLHAGRSGAWKQPRLAAMAQPAVEPRSDEVVPRRSLGGMTRIAPADPEAFRTSLNGTLGFVFEKTAAHRVLYTPLHTQAQVDAARGKATPVLLHAPLLGGFFDDLWDGVKDVANTVADTVTKVVVTITDTINLAVTTMVNGLEKIAHSVVSSVKDALNAIADFFEQIGAAIAKVIAFLRALFDWGAILEAKNIVKGTIELSLDAAKQAMSPKNIEAAFLPLINAAPSRSAPGARSVNGGTTAAGQAQSPALAESRSVQGQMVAQKSRENPITVASSDPPAVNSDVESPFQDLITAIPSMIGSLLDSPPSDMVDKLLTLLKQGVETSVRLMIKSLSEASAMLQEVIDWIMKILKTPIRIPFLSDLYKWITGSELTLFDLICLGLAVPVHVAHIAVTTFQGKTRTFAQDNADLVDRLRTAMQRRGLRVEPSLRADDEPAERPVLQRMDTSIEPYIITLRSINLLAGLASDALFTKTVSSGGIGAANAFDAQARAMVKMLKGATGITASLLQTLIAGPAFDARMKSGLTAGAWEKVKPKDEIVWSTFGVLTAGDMFTFGGGAKQLLDPPIPQSIDYGPIDPGRLDKAEAVVSLGAAALCIALIVKRKALYDEALEVLKSDGAHDSLVDQVHMYFYRDISMIVGRMPWFMFTQTGANFFGRKPMARALYIIVTGVRALAGGAAITTHVLAAYKYGQRT